MDTFDLPDWLRVAPTTTSKSKQAPAEAVKSLMHQQFEVHLPRILEKVCEGWTLNRAVTATPCDPPISTGAFMRWLKKRPDYYQLFLDAKEIRSEWYVGRMVELAEGTEDNPVELDRAKVAIDLYKWIASRENRKQYGDTKTIEMNTSISITAALSEAKERVIDARLIDDDDSPPIEPPKYLLEAPVVDDEDDY